MTSETLLKVGAIVCALCMVAPLSALAGGKGITPPKPKPKPKPTLKPPPKSATEKALDKLRVNRPIDFALHLPIRYEDETEITKLERRLPLLVFEERRAAAERVLAFTAFFYLPG